MNKPRLADLFRIESNYNNELGYVERTRVPAGIGHVLGFFTESYTAEERYTVALVEKLDGTMDTFPVGQVQFKEPTSIALTTDPTPEKK